MTRPLVIGVVGSRIGAAAAAEMGYGWRELDAYDIHCMEALTEAGMAPVGIPSLGLVAGRALDVVDGLVLSADGHCEHLGLRPAVGLAPPVRALVGEALAQGLPVLGICGGIAALPATSPADGGVAEAPASAPRVPEIPRTIRVVDPALREVLGGEVTVVLPHPLRDLPAMDGMEVAAVADDGSVVALLGTTAPVLAVRWHPETLPVGDPAREGVFRWLRWSIAAVASG